MNLLPDDIVNLSAATVEKLDEPVLQDHGISADVLRLDKIHPVISGNKWFKLKYYLQEAREQQYSSLLTFGGAYSNHIVATACAAQQAGLKSIGIIRGEKPALISHTLSNAMRYGMQLEFMSRSDYSKKNDPALLAMLAKKYQQPYFIAEGGEGMPGIRGAAEILQLVDKTKYSHLLCAVGTATLLKGIIQSSVPQQKLLGVLVLKGFENSLAEIPAPTDTSMGKRIELVHDYHFGGYAKNNAELFAFMNGLYRQTGIATDFVYTGKLFFAAMDLVKKKHFPVGSSLLIIHSGGLQGNGSLAPGTLVF